MFNTAWDSTKTIGDVILTDEYNAHVSDQLSRGIPNTETKLGSACSGTDGTLSRVLTLANTLLLKTGGFLVFRNGSHITPLDYSINNKVSAEVTFTNVNIFDTDVITIIYFT